MKEVLQRNIKPILLLLAAAVGVIMICFSGKSEKDKATESGPYGSELESYAEMLEEKLVTIVESIDGAGDAVVMITFESSFEKVYANNARVEENGNAVGENFGKTSEKEIVLAGSGTSGEQPVLLKERCPEVKGVVVVCDGAENENTRRKIKEAASALFGISEFNVYVTQGN